MSEVKTIERGRIGQSADGGLINHSARCNSGDRNQNVALSRMVEEEWLYRLCVRAVQSGNKANTDNGAHVKRKVLRTAQLQSVANWVHSHAITAFEKLEPALVELLRKYDPTDIQETASLFSESDEAIAETFGTLRDEVEEKLVGIAKAVAEKARAGLKEHHGLKAGKPSLAHVAMTPVLGATLGEHFEKMMSDAQFRFKALVRTGLQAGDNSEKLIKRIEGTNESVTASEVHIHASDTALEIMMRLLDTSENSVNKVIQAAIQAFAHEAETSTGEETEVSEKKMGYQWVTAMDDKVCPECEALEGARWDAEFEPVDESPKYPGDPPLHFNCFLGDTIITPIGRVSAVTKRIFNGDVVKVTTSNHNFTCTPNHPILTDLGWVAAKLLNQGSYVVGYVAGQNPLIVKWENEHGKTSFHELFESSLLVNNLTARKVPAAPPYFHGDGIGGEITVVNTNSLLTNESKFTFRHFLHKLVFEMGRGCASSQAFKTFSAFNAFLDGVLSTFACYMSSRSEMFDLFIRSDRHSCELLLAGVPNFHSSFLETVSNHSSVNSHLNRNSTYSDTGVINGDCFIPINNRTFCMGGAKRYSKLFEPSINKITRDRELAGKIVSGDTGLVKFHKVIKIDVCNFSGHVFNCETSNNYYTVNGIIVHNCRCAITPTDLEQEAAPKQSFDEYLSQFSRSEQEQAFGKANLRAYQRGDIGAGQLIGQKSNLMTLEQFKEGGV